MSNNTDPRTINAQRVGRTPEGRDVYGTGSHYDNSDPRTRRAPAGQPRSTAEKTPVRLTRRGAAVGTLALALLASGAAIGSKAYQTGKDHETHGDANERVFKTVNNANNDVIRLSGGATFRYSPNIDNGDNTIGRDDNIAGTVKSGQELYAVRPLTYKDSDNNIWIGFDTDSDVSSARDRAVHTVWANYTELQQQTIDGTNTPFAQVIAHDHVNPTIGISFMGNGSITNNAGGNVITAGYAAGKNDISVQAAISQIQN